MGFSLLQGLYRTVKKNDNFNIKLCNFPEKYVKYIDFYADFVIFPSIIATIQGRAKQSY